MISLFFIGYSSKSHKDDEKHKTKKCAQSNCINGVVKKDKLNSDSKKHNESNSMLFVLFKCIIFYKTKMLF